MKRGDFADDPVSEMNGCALWYSAEEEGYYWQDEEGYGKRTSQVFFDPEEAEAAMENGEVDWYEN